MARKIVRAGEVRDLLGGVSNTTLHRYIANQTIPKPFKIGKVNGWFSDEIQKRLDEIAKNQAA